MKISPCGWFCFQEPDTWICQDTSHSMLFSLPLTSAKIEITSARKTDFVDEEDVLELQSKMVQKIQLTPEETSIFQNPAGTTCIQTVCSDSYRVLGIVHVFWERYCVKIQLEAPLDAEIEVCVQALKEILLSLEPLTFDA